MIALKPRKCFTHLCYRHPCFSSLEVKSLLRLLSHLHDFKEIVLIKKKHIRMGEPSDGCDDMITDAFVSKEVRNKIHFSNYNT